MSSGGHSPWSYPVKVYSVKRNTIASFSDMINGGPTIAAQFQFSGPHSVVASTWKRPGDLDDKVPVTVDLDVAFAKLPAAPIQALQAPLARLLPACGGEGWDERASPPA